MLISARTYRQSQDNGKDSNHSGLTFHQAASSRAHAEATRRAKKMLLLHQTGSVKIGEVIRYTLTYTPSLDRILPSPSALHIKIKNTSAIPLRAAYLHGPYTLYTACYPSTFDPNYKSDKPWEQDVPQFEPNLKAGGSWHAQLTVPERIRETAGKANVKRTTDGGIPSITWVIEISSQIIFSTSAAVHFELLVGRDRKSVDLGTQIAGIMGSSNDSPGKLQDHQEGKKHRDGRGAAQPKGVFSNAINVIVDDTTSLWNKPTLPEWDDVGRDRSKKREYPDPGEEDFFQYGAALGRKSMESLKPGGKPKAPKQRRNIHLVVLTHGLHSNLGADLLYLKESIDITARQAREDARKRKATQREGEQKCKSREARNADAQPTNNDTGPRSGPLEGGQEGMDNRETGGDEDEEEEVIVRGFTGNAVRTERGIQYLGKRLARYVLSMTYPDQPFLPIKKSAARKISRALTSSDPPDMHSGLPAHSHSSIHREYKNPDHLAYKISSISFIGHSLGGLVQMYAIAYIHKHSPHFFDEIKPINFITMASPLLGLSNENPIYVKFALDFGLVGRTGQDLGLTWRAPTMVRSGWGAMIGGIGTDAQRAHRHPDPGAKPLLRVLPTGPAHKVLKMFRNRTVYSNVVNDGIVPLRTSCLLFLDWRGLGRVEKARRENGLVGTMAGWGWAEITGANSSAHRQPRPAVDGGNSSQTGDSGDDRDGTNMPTRKGQGRTVPQPAENATEDDNETQGGKEHDAHTHSSSQAFEDEAYDAEKGKHSSAQQPVHPLAGLLSFLRPSSSKSHHHPHKHRQIYERSQTKAGDTADDGDDEGTSATNTSIPKKRPIATRGDSQIEDPENLFAPPKTTFFEAAGDVLKPPLPTEEFLVNPSSRPRTIFHDRVYHPHDIPPPPPKKAGASSPSNDSRNSIPRSSNATQAHNTTADTSGMKVEEKIARAYHKDLSWRKVLVRLEPDAHNNMIVRRMFSNAYGWPVIKHLCDTHFADTHAATTADTKESSEERAKPMAEGVGSHGEEVNNQSESPLDWRGDERREAKDQVPKLRTGHESSMSIAMGHRKRSETLDSADWDDRFFDPTDDDDDDDIDFPVAARPRSHSQHDGASPAIAREKDCRPSMSERSSQTELPGFLTSEPEEMENIEHAGQCNVAPERQVGDPVWASTSGTSALAGSTSGLGLRRSGGEQLDLPSRTRKIDVRYA